MPDNTHKECSGNCQACANLQRIEQQEEMQRQFRVEAASRGIPVERQGELFPVVKVRTHRSILSIFKK